jgi:hypothetical protein
MCKHGEQQQQLFTSHLHTGKIAETDVGVEEKDFNARTEGYTHENEEDDDDGCGESLAIALSHWFLFFLPIPQQNRAHSGDSLGCSRY